MPQLRQRLPPPGRPPPERRRRESLPELLRRLPLLDWFDQFLYRLRHATQARPNVPRVEAIALPLVAGTAHQLTVQPSVVCSRCRAWHYMVNGPSVCTTVLVQPEVTIASCATPVGSQPNLTLVALSPPTAFSILHYLITFPEKIPLWMKASSCWLWEFDLGGAVLA